MYKVFEHTMFKLSMFKPSMFKPAMLQFPISGMFPKKFSHITESILPPMLYKTKVSPYTPRRRFLATPNFGRLTLHRGRPLLASG